MSDQIQLELGKAPWLAATDVRPGEVFDRYDVPIAGELTQHGTDFIFQCLEGVVTRPSVWLYAPVQRGELDELKDLDGDAFDERIFEIMTSRDITVAYANQDRIFTFGLLDAWTMRDIGLDETIGRWLEALADAGQLTSAF